ncbi:MAG TPA: alpha/beta hydrolase [Blastocatellia bacterium]|jgi:pimeloyl-ACP methyl ester carboxylesterase
MTTPQSRTLNLGDGRPVIEVLEAGEGPPLLFLHGAGGIVAWEGVLPLLSSRCHVYAPLLPGFGASTGLEYLEDQFDLFMHGFDLIEALGLERPYVVGESFGGWMAAEMAALRPKEIGRLALLAPVGLWRDEAPVADIFGMTPGELVQYLFHDQSCLAAQRMMMLTMLFSDKDDRSQEQVEILLSMSRGFRTVAKFLFPVPENGLERRLRRIEAPTLIVWGEHDRLVSPIYAGLFHDKIANAEVVKIPDTGHVIGLESPDPLAEALLRWGQGQ